MMDSLPGFGLLGGMPTNGAAQQQQASNDYWRRQQEGMLNALGPTPAQQHETERYYATKRYVERLRAERSDALDGFLLWLGGLTLAALLVVALRGHW